MTEERASKVWVESKTNCLSLGWKKESSGSVSNEECVSACEDGRGVGGMVCCNGGSRGGCF